MGPEIQNFHPAPRWFGCCHSQTRRRDGSLPLGKEDIHGLESFTWQESCVKIPVAFVCHVATSVFMVPALVFGDSSAGSLGKVSLGDGWRFGDSE